MWFQRVTFPCKNFWFWVESEQDFFLFGDVEVPIRYCKSSSVCITKGSCRRPTFSSRKLHGHFKTLSGDSHGIFQRIFKVSPRIFEGSLKDFQGLSEFLTNCHGLFKGLLMLLQRNYQDFSSYFQGVYIRFARILQGILKTISRTFQWIFKVSSKDFQGILNVSSTDFYGLFQDTFKDFSRYFPGVFYLMSNQVIIVCQGLF